MARALRLLFGACGTFGCFGNQAGQPLAKLPAVQLEALMATTNPSGGSITLNLLPADPSQCPKLADSVQADVNGQALRLAETGGWLSRKGGEKYCQPPSFEGSGLPLSGDAVIHVRDATATFELDAPGVLSAMSTTLVQPAGGALQPGAMATVQLAPLVGTIVHALVVFVPAGATTASLQVEFPSGGSTLSVSNDRMSFNVPTGTAPGAGTLQLSFSVAVSPTACQGPATCAAQTGGKSSMATSIVSP